jgi:hypothetical protein
LTPGTRHPTAIRQSLAKLPAKLAELNYNVTEFNTYINKLQISALLARGDESPDLLVNIFDALATVPDQSFRAYIFERIKDQSDENDEKVTADYLMARSEIKCKNLQCSNNYNVPSKEEEKIIALSAEVDRMKAVSTAPTTLSKKK